MNHALGNNDGNCKFWVEHATTRQERAAFHRMIIMAQSNPRSLDDIKRDTEQARAGLTQTVDQLRSSVTETADDIRHRIHPDTIKAEVSSYIRTRGEQFLDDVTSAARRNPMQAVAVGVSMAYPLLRLARAIPLPVLMVGAGVYFAGSKSGQRLTQRASDAASDLAGNASELADKVAQRAHDLSGEVNRQTHDITHDLSQRAQRVSDEVTRRAQNLGDQLGDGVAAAKAYVNDGLNRASETAAVGSDELRRRTQAAGAAMASGADDIENRAASVAERAAGLKDRTVAMAGSAAAAMQDAAMSAADMARQSVGAAADAGLDAAKAARAKASELTDRAGKTLSQSVEQNPLLVAGVGLVIGALIASALPRTDLEDGLIGGASSAAKRRAGEAAAQGLDAAKQAAGEAYDNVTAQAATEGLTPDSIGKVAQTLGERVKRVADTAVNTALEQPKANQPTQKSPSNGESNHG
jgi:hypothetical protein